MAFRVGVVGHRPDRLAAADREQLRATLRTVLIAVQDEVRAVGREEAALFDAAAPVLRALSPLAEGTDRLFAEQALALGWELCCVMPFPQAEFEQDFAPGKALEPDALARFRTLLERARAAGRLTRFELDGSREDEGAAYGAGGRVVIDQSDLLVVVWDGERQGKRGGTEETLDEARRRGVPFVWIDARAPHAWQGPVAGLVLPEAAPGELARPDGTGSPEEVRRVVRQSLAMPQPRSAQDHQPGAKEREKKRREEPRRNLERFYREHRPRWTTAVAWKAFRDLVADRQLPRVSWRVADFEESVVEEWPRVDASPGEQRAGSPPGSDDPAEGQRALALLVDRLRPYYAWSDKPADLFADRYRSAFVLAFLLAAAAVGFALAPIAFGLVESGAGETIFTALELAAILGISSLVLLGRARAWHERWLDYRLTAELIRHLRLVVPVGGGRPFAHVPAHLGTYGQPEATWMDWYVRAIARSLGLPDAVVDHRHLKAGLAHLEDLLVKQRDYHGASAKRSRDIEHRLQIWGLVLLGLTLVACTLHLIHVVPYGRALAAATAFLPALAAALAGIANQGEFRRVAKRSEAMQERLELLLERVGRARAALETTSPPRAFSPKVRELAGEAAGLLVSEVLDWRVVFLDRPLTMG